MRFLVIDTVSPNEQHDKLQFPEDVFRPSSNERHWDEPPFTKLENFIRKGYEKPVDEFDFHLHYEKMCTGHTDVPAKSFDLLVQLKSLFPGSGNREYYVCFTPKSNPPAQLPATPISEQSGASPVSDVAVQSTEHEHPLENTDGIEADFYFRRAATAPAPAQLSALRRGIPTSLPIHPRTKRPIEGDPNVQEENKRPRITDEARVIVGLSNDQPDVPKIERIQDGLPGSRADPIVIPEPEPADPHQQAYNFFLAHKLPHVFRFEVGIINPDKIPDTWELDKEGRLNKVTVHLETTGRRLLFLLMDRDKDNAYLERPSHSRINMNVVSFWPAIKHLQHKEHLKSFLRSYGPALRRGDPFETASIVDLGSEKSGDECDHESIEPSNEADKTVSTMPKASRVVTLHIEPSKFATLVEKIYRSCCTNCKTDKKNCQPLEWGGYLGCMRCKERGLICSLSSIREDPGTSLTRAAKAKLHRSLREMQNGMGHGAAAEPGTMTGAHLSEIPPSGSDYEVRHGSDQIAASDSVERQEISQVSDRPPIPDGAGLMGGSSVEEDEHRMLYGVTPPRSHRFPNPQNARVNLKITFEDLMKIPDNSRPLHFGPCYALAFDTWTASAVVDRVLRKQIKKQVLDTPKKRLGNQHKNDLLVADLTVWLVLGGGLAPSRKLLFRSFDLDESSPSEKGWLEKAVERGFLKVDYGCTVELNVEMFSNDGWRGQINPIKRDR